MTDRTYLAARNNLRPSSAPGPGGSHALAPRPLSARHRCPERRRLAIEYRDGGQSQRVAVRAGQVDWDEPTDRIHRGVNVGSKPYEEITIFFLDHPDAAAQPAEV